jgi:hypothetical protein
MSRSWLRPQAGATAPMLSAAQIPREGRAGQGEGTEVFDRLVCEPGSPCRSHGDPAATPSVRQATRARRAARYQDRQDQLVAEKECRTAGPSPFLPRSAMEALLTAPLWPRHIFRKMPKTCRVA